MPRYDDDRQRRYEDDDDLPPRESLMQRRLRRARGEDVDDDLDEDLDEPRNSRRTTSYIPAYEGSSGGGGCAQIVLYLTLGAITIALLALLFGQRVFEAATQSVPDQVRQRVETVIATPTATVRDRGGTIQQIKALNRLESQQFSVERVVEARVERGNALDALLGERLLLIASGDVVAGVDLSKLTPDDINISADGSSVTLRLPPSEIFSARLNNERTRVYDRQTRIGTQITGGQDPNLETQARQEAERQILLAACEGNIMQRAADDAQRSMEQLLRLLEFTSVTVVATPGTCVAPPVQ
jgi:hypothetical protein